MQNMFWVWWQSNKYKLPPLWAVLPENLYWMRGDLMTRGVFAPCKDRSWYITSMIFRLGHVRESQTQDCYYTDVKFWGCKSILFYVKCVVFNNTTPTADCTYTCVHSEHSFQPLLWNRSCAHLRCLKPLKPPVFCLVSVKKHMLGTERWPLGALIQLCEVLWHI